MYEKYIIRNKILNVKRKLQKRESKEQRSHKNLIIFVTESQALHFCLYILFNKNVSRQGKSLKSVPEPFTIDFYYADISFPSIPKSLVVSFPFPHSILKLQFCKQKVLPLPIRILYVRLHTSKSQNNDQ